MIPNEKYVEIARGLLRKTETGTAKWVQGAGEMSEFVLNLPASRIFLQYTSPTVEDDRITLALCQPEGRAVGSWIVHESDPDWELAQTLYSAVSRQVVGWDRVLEDIESFLQKSGV